MAASDIPPTGLILRIAGMKGDPATGGFNVQSYVLSLERSRTEEKPLRRTLSVTRLADEASPAISMAFALRAVVASDVTLVALGADGTEVASYVLKDPIAARYEVTAAVGGNERATESVDLFSTQLTITIAKSKTTTIA